MASDEAHSRGSYLLWTVGTLAVLLGVRLAVIVGSDFELYADEAQYWRWSRTLDWGYYSKPPLIAWVIAASTAIAGNAEWGVRLAAPVLHTGAALALFALGRAMYGASTGFFAAIGYAVMPGVMVSSFVISTDGVLLPFWCTGLWLLWRLREARAGWAEAALLGFAIGLCFLAKYATLYFFIGIALTSLIDTPTRKAVLSGKGVLAGLCALSLIGPHLLWNAANDFQTVGHTVDNANLGGPLFNLENLPKFLADQMGVFGPIGFLTLLAGLFIFTRVRSASIDLRRMDRWLLCFILPVLIMICFQAVLSRAHANWAATAYPAATVLVAAWLVRSHPNQRLWFAIAAVCLVAFQAIPDVAFALKAALGGVFAVAVLAVGAASKWRPSGLLSAAIGLHAAIFLTVIGLVIAPPSVATGLGLDNAMKRVKGWEDTARAIQDKAVEIGATSILIDEREIWHGVDYYAGNGLEVPLIAWRRNAGIKSFSEREPMTDAIDDKVLVASYRPGFRPRIRGDFDRMVRIGETTIPLGTRTNGCPIFRRIVFYEASGFTPEERTQTWEDEYRGLREDPNPTCPSSGG